MIGYTFWSASYSLLTILLFTITIEFELLREDLKNYRKNLKELITRHELLFSIVRKLERIYSPTFLSNFIFTSLIICFNAFQMTITTHFSNFSIDCMICSGGFCLIALQCYFGQMLKDASERMGEEIYELGWETIEDKKMKKSLMIMMMRAQRPASLTIFKFSKITLEQFNVVS
jgi:hypothetical protein